MALSMQELSDIMCEFFEVAIHSILFIYRVYPSTLFEKRKKYNVPVHMSRSYELNLYIWELTTNLKGLIEKGSLEKVIVSIKTGDSKEVIERYVFETNFQQTSKKMMMNTMDLTCLEAELRAFILTLLVSPDHIAQTECSFSVEVHTFEDTISEYWAPVHVSKKTTNPSSPALSLTPIKSLRGEEPFTMQLFLEKATNNQT